MYTQHVVLEFSKADYFDRVERSTNFYTYGGIGGNILRVLQ